MGSGVGLLLLTAVAGYWVLERASKHKGQLKRIGQIVGLFVIIVSILGSICSVACLSSGKYGSCLLSKKGKTGFYPHSFKSQIPDSN